MWTEPVSSTDRSTSSGYTSPPALGRERVGRVVRVSVAVYVTHKKNRESYY